MVTFKCHNKECAYFPCFLRCDKSASENEFGDGGVDRPRSCPYDMDEADYRLLPYTPVTQNTVDLLQDWYDNAGYDVIPEKTMELIDGLMPSNNDDAWLCHRLPQLLGWLRDAEAEYWQRSETIEKLRKVKGLQAIRELMPAFFRAGFLYAEKIRRTGEADFTRFDED